MMTTDIKATAKVPASLFNCLSRFCQYVVMKEMNSVTWHKDTTDSWRDLVYFVDKSSSNLSSIFLAEDCVCNFLSALALHINKIEHDSVELRLRRLMDYMAKDLGLTFVGTLASSVLVSTSIDIPTSVHFVDMAWTVIRQISEKLFRLEIRTNPEAKAGMRWLPRDAHLLYMCCTTLLDPVFCYDDRFASQCTVTLFRLVCKRFHKNEHDTDSNQIMILSLQMLNAGLSELLTKKYTRMLTKEEAESLDQDDPTVSLSLFKESTDDDKKQIEETNLEKEVKALFEEQVRHCPHCLHAECLDQRKESQCLAATLLALMDNTFVNEKKSRRVYWKNKDYDSLEKSFDKFPYATAVDLHAFTEQKTFSFCFSKKILWVKWTSQKKTTRNGVSYKLGKMTHEGTPALCENGYHFTSIDLLDQWKANTTYYECKAICIAKIIGSAEFDNYKICATEIEVVDFLE